MTQEDVEVFNRAKKMKKSTIPKELKPTIIKYSEKNSDDIKHIGKEIEMLHKQAMKIDDAKLIIDTVITLGETNQILEAVIAILHHKNGHLEDYIKKEGL